MFHCIYPTNEIYPLIKSDDEKEFFKKVILNGEREVDVLKFNV